MTRILSVLLFLSLVAGCGAASPPSAVGPAPAPEAPRARLGPDELTVSLLAQLGRASGCPASRSVWCIPGGGWAGGSAADLPAGDRAILGVSVALERGRPDGELLREGAYLTVLALHAGQGLIADIPAQSASEQRAIDAAMASVTRVLDGSAARVAVAPALGRYLDTLPASASYPLVREGASWRMHGKAEAWIRRVGRSWVAVEIPADGPEGIFVTVFAE